MPLVLRHMRTDHGCAGLSQGTLRRVIHALICQLLCGAKRCIVVLVSPRRALVRRAVGVHRAGGHSRGARTALLLVVLLLAVLLYAATVTVLWPPQPCPSYLPYAAERRRTLRRTRLLSCDRTAAQARALRYG